MPTFMSHSLAKKSANGGQTDQFKDRTEAGQFLARSLSMFAHRPDVLVLALPRGGVPVGYEIAAALQAPLDVFIVRKLGVPAHPELAMGAIASGGARILNREVIGHLEIPRAVIDEVARKETRELERREAEYRPGREPLVLTGRMVILVDDGLATGASMRVAVQAVRQHHPARVVVAVPVGAPGTCRELAREADEVICGRQPPDFQTVGAWYEDFTQTTDETVCRLLADSVFAIP